MSTIPFNNSKENRLSKGCQLCQQGRWLCIFLTYRCNAGCHFCASPFRDNRIKSCFGNKKEEILPYLLKYDFGGISFSGGDPFLVPDRLSEWLRYFKNNLPDFYFWAYTSGLEADRASLEKISKEGLDEIRFNIAATGYQNKLILERIKISRDLFPFVAVEIPSISEDYPLLESVLEELDSIDIDFLNLHDYILTPTDAINFEGSTSDFILNKINKLCFESLSPDNTSKIGVLIENKGYRFRVNHCSMEKKEFQMQQRRLKMGEIFNNPEFDEVQDDGTNINYYCLPEEISVRFADVKRNPSVLNNLLKPYRIKIAELNNVQQYGKKITLVRYIPQMEVNQDKVILNIEEIR
jgi:pyruvate formate-lyase activating enzyme-like uncharacterized protein